MKASVITAAALAGLASAATPARRANHDNLFKAKRGHSTAAGTAVVAAASAADEECGCTTVYSTWYGEPTLIFPPAVAAYANTTSAPVQVASVTPAPVSNTSTTAVAVPPTTTSSAVKTSTPVVVPTPAVETCPTAGVYTFPATTLTITETTTVCGATTTVVPKGTHTVGGVTTSVTEACTITAAIPVVTTGTDAVVTSTIESTVYVCPSSGVYTIAPTTVTVTKEVDQTVVVPCVTSYLPGVYSKDVVIVTATVDEYVTVCPFSGGPTTSTVAPSTSAVPTTSTAVTTSAPAATTSAVVYTTSAAASSSVASSVATSSASKTTSSKTSTSTGTIFQGQQDDHWAITYTPYTDDTGACKSKAAVLADITAIKALGFTTVRVYSTDCDTLENVGGACESLGIRMIIGIFIKEAGCGYSGEVKEQVEGILSWGKFDIVDMLVVGNEAVFGGLCTASQLSSLITTVKSTCASAGYTGYISTAETVDVWQANSELLCNAVDVAGAQTHPYFNAETTPATAGSFVKGQLDIVKALCNKPTISLECGWPTQGSCNGAACPGVSEQAEAMASVRDTCGIDVVFFTYGEAMWKNPGSCGCEPYFNILSVFEALL